MISKNGLISILGQHYNSHAIYDFEKKLLAPLVEEDSLPNERSFSCFEEGLSLLFEDDKLSSIHLYFVTNKYDYSKYNGWIGDGVDTSLISLSNVERILGRPSRKGGGEKGFLGKIDPPWIRYDFSDYVIHYTFSLDGNEIELITLMTLESAP